MKDAKCVVSAAHLPQSPVELTISGGSVTLAQEFHLIDTEGDAASDVLDAIVFGPIREGQRVALMLADSGRPVYLAASSTIGLPCLLSADWPTEFRRYGGKLWPLNDRILRCEEPFSIAQAAGRAPVAPRPKKRGPDQRVPVIARAMTERER